MTIIYHGTPMTPNAAFEAVMSGRAACVSFFRPDQIELAIQHCPFIMLDNGAFSFWRQAQRDGHEFDQAARDWSPYYRWLEPILFHPGRWAVIPDIPGAPSQLNDGLLNDWPFGAAGAPLWHMNGPITRLARLCEKYPRVCLGWIGETADEQKVGCDAYRRKMDEIAALFGNRWPVIHMMRGVAVARDYPFRQRGQHVSRPKRVALRLAGRGAASILNVRRAAAGRTLAGPQRLCGQAGGRS